MNTSSKYRHIGMKLTPQRLAILEYLEGNTTHPSAEDVYQGIHEKYPTMSLATVYSTLAALKEKGNILELSVDPDKKRYDPNTSMHNHLICLACKTIVDIPGSGWIDLPDSARQDFDVLKSHVEFFGYCPKCQNQDSTHEEASHVCRSQH